ncbi:uncharacterized protein LOC119376549 [Rhipicephalus sanguineus]|uniref:uncharacterized protein LOC119376549 n=1 Tax=Rhipicephalus sanguineus TaxID=34632 RepID=UPI001894CFF0|nr:uncharacterized protein LOC119376549 [Rhipicephalus sanguineus]
MRLLGPAERRLATGSRHVWDAFLRRESCWRSCLDIAPAVYPTQQASAATAMSRLGKIEEFDAKVQTFDSYLERFEHFVSANDIAQEKKLSVFLTVIGAEAYEVLKNLVVPSLPGEKTFDEVKVLLKSHYSPPISIIAERARPVPFALREAVEKQLDELEKDGVVTRHSLLREVSAVTTSFEHSTCLLALAHKDAGGVVLGSNKAALLIMYILGRQLLMEEAAVDYLAAMCDGDARTALNSLQTAVEAHRSTGGSQLITAESIKEGLKRTHFHYDRAGDQHYDIISAFIKSMRGGDANAALYYMARMLAGGEDPLFIARRLVVFASEDIGVADSHALVLAVATHDSVLKVGLPECRIMLSHCATYCARAPKSRETYNAYARAEDAVQKQEGPLPAVPVHLRNHASPKQRAEGCGKPFLPQQLAHLDFFK